MEFLEEFQNPPVKYRIKPFWFWNGEITKEEITSQIKEMAQKGLGGVFICARQGMTLPYLSNEWFHMVDYACNEAKRYGLEAWLYDEYPYPSGMSGGEVLLLHPEAEHRILRHKTFFIKGGDPLNETLGWGRILHAAAYPVDKEGKINWTAGLSVTDCVGTLQTEKIYQETGLTTYNNKRFFSYGPQKIVKTVLPEGNWKVEIYTEEAMGEFKYYGGFFDPCNKEAVKTFLKTTHERYRNAFGEQFGDGIFGMFSDEVGLLGPVPWSKLLPEEFEKRNHYSLLSELPALHNVEFPNAIRIRYDLYCTVYELFGESYHKQVSDWCGSNHLLYATEVPSMRMGTQRYSDIVGGDTAHEKLGKPLEWIYDEYIKSYRSNAKSVSSLARQLDKKYAMIESFHSIGWTMTIQDAKWMIDRLGSSGINFYNFHAFYYTIEDITKHDAPPSQFLQNPYWKYYKKIADYAGRMGMIISNTEADIQIAVLDPVSAMWTKLGNPFHRFQYEGESREEKTECDQIRDSWVSLCKSILFHQLDYDHLDAEILQEGRIEAGRLNIGRASYSVVILPECHCMEKEARQKLEEFVKQGGCVIAMGELPNTSLDWESDDETEKKQWERLFELEQAYVLPKEEKVNSLIGLCRSHIKETAMIHVLSGSQKELVCSCRLDPEGNAFVFTANQGKEPMKLKIQTHEPIKKAETWDLEQGTVTSYDCGRDEVDVVLDGFESRLIKLTLGEGMPKNKQRKTNVPTVLTLSMKGNWELKPRGKNLCRFSHVLFSFDQKIWKETETKTFLEQCMETGLLDGGQLSFKGTFGTPRKIRPSYPITCFYKTSFQISEIPSELFLLMDRQTAAGEHTITINGKALKKEVFQPVRVDDQNNRAADILPFIHMGENEVEVIINVKKDEEGLRDPFYLWGDFAVESSPDGITLVSQPRFGEPDLNWCKGYPYYSGTMDFEKTVDLKELTGKGILSENDVWLIRTEFSRPFYDCMEIFINENPLGVKAYTPYEWNCDHSFLKEKDNRIRVSITNTLSNMLDGTYFDYENHKLVSIEP